jgi:hypothetical protein
MRKATAEVSPFVTPPQFNPLHVGADIALDHHPYSAARRAIRAA